MDAGTAAATVAGPTPMPAPRVTPGAVAVELDSLESLAQLLHQHPQSLVAVSDVHAELDKLKEVLERLGAIDGQGQRTGRGRLLQLGDLVDGRDERDYDTLVWGSETFDMMLVGNHEAALMGATTFSGQQFTTPEMNELLRRLTNPYNMRLTAAHSENGVLFTHAGAHPQLYPTQTPGETADAINQHWERFLMRSTDKPAELFGVPAERGGTSEHGGALWQDWSTLLEVPRAEFRQVVGHSAKETVEADPQGQVFCIDTKGPRLGVSLLLPDGSMRFSSDRI